MKIAIIVLSLLCSFFTFLPILKIPHWTVRLWDYPLKQLLVLQSLFFIIYLVAYWSNLNPVYLSIPVFAIGFLVYQIVPYTAFHKKQLANSATEKGDSVTILISNVEMKNNRYGDLVKLIQTNQPDVIMLLETDKKWMEGVQEIENDYAFTQHQHKTILMEFYFTLKKKCVMRNINFW